MASAQRLPIAVLASGRGSNLEALIAAREHGELPVDIVLVASDRTQARALRTAEAAGIATLALDPAGYADRASYDLDLFTRLGHSGAQLLVLAGFMRILDARAIAPWAGRMLNIHPSLLPRHRGLHTHRRALAAGDREHGASVHFVSAELDGGPVVAQVKLSIKADDTETGLATRLLPLEHRLLVATVALLAAGRVHLWHDRVMLDGVPLQTPLQWGENGWLP